MNNEIELSISIAKFKRDFPGWWWSVGEDERGPRASCAPFLNGSIRELLHHVDGDDPLDLGFHARGNTENDALRDVMAQAKAWKEKKDEN